MEKLKIAFFGTPDFAVPTIEMLYNHPQIDLVQVVSMPDRKSGRGQKLPLLKLSRPLPPPPVAVRFGVGRAPWRRS